MVEALTRARSGKDFSLHAVLPPEMLFHFNCFHTNLPRPRSAVSARCPVNSLSPKNSLLLLAVRILSADT